MICCKNNLIYYWNRFLTELRSYSLQRAAMYHWFFWISCLNLSASFLKETPQRQGKRQEDVAPLMPGFQINFDNLNFQKNDEEQNINQQKRKIRYGAWHRHSRPSQSGTPWWQQSTIYHANSEAKLVDNEIRRIQTAAENTSRDCKANNLPTNETLPR